MSILSRRKSRSLLATGAVISLCIPRYQRQSRRSGSKAQALRALTLAITSVPEDNRIACTGKSIISCSDFPCQFAALPGGFSVFIAGCKKSCNLSITAHFWRRVRDLNPRDAHHAYTISNRAPSTTQPTLHLVKLLFVCVNRSEQYVLYRPFAVFVNSFFEIFHF